MRFVRTRAASSYDAIKKVKILTLWHFLFLCTGCSWVSSKRLLISVRLFLMQLRLAFPIVSHRAFRGTADLHTYFIFSSSHIMHKSIPAMPIAPPPLPLALLLGPTSGIRKKKGKFLGVGKTNKSVKCP